MAQLIHKALSAPAVVAMPVSKVGAATRAFVAVLLAVARCYQLLVQVNRDSSPEDLLKAYKRVLLKAHKADRKLLRRWCEETAESVRRGGVMVGSQSGSETTPPMV